jgi:hypothetical protein
VSGVTEQLGQQRPGAVVIQVQPHKRFRRALSWGVSNFGWPS